MGWPTSEPRTAGTWITTFGASRVSGEVLAELLTREDPSVG
jgi:hypothetical protein